MSTIVTRNGKGSALTWTEMDDNFTNLNTDKYQAGNNVTFATATVTTINASTYVGLPVFAGSTAGIVPTSVGGTANYLRADGSWAAPPGASSGTVTSVGITSTVLSVSGSPVTTSGNITLGVNNGVITNAMLASMADQTFKGNTSGGAAAPSDLTATQATAMLNSFTSLLKGLAPASGGGTTNFLRADGTWAAPSVGGVAWGTITGTLSSQTDLDTALSGKQPLDSDLTTIAGLTATTDNFLQAKSSAWASRTVAQVSTDLQSTGLVADSVGFRQVPQNLQATNYTIVAADSGKHLYHLTGGTTSTFTIPANGSVAFPIGTAITFVNDGASGNLTIAITTDVLRLAGAGTTGSRTLAPYGVATALKIASVVWIISGTGLT